jgi:hypothetical protein
VVPPCSNKISRVSPYSSFQHLLLIRDYHPLWSHFPMYSNLFLLKDRPDPLSLVATNGISVDFFSSGYLDISVLQVHFSKLCIHLEMSSKLDGLPHSEIHGSKVINTYPQLIAVCRVLHRLMLSRHPPNTLFIIFLSQITYIEQFLSQLIKFLI